MYTEVKRKKLLLDNRKPYSREAHELIKEQGELDLVYGEILLEGLQISKTDVQSIIKGDYVVSCSISDHLVIRNYCDIINLFNEMISMGDELDEISLVRIYRIFTKNAEVAYRTNNPVVHSIDYIPPHFNDIENQMKLLFDFIKSIEKTENKVVRAAYIHNKLIEIFPFEDSNFEIARLGMAYELYKNDLPLFMFDIKEQNYYEMVRKYLKTEDIGPLSEILYDLILKKQEFLLSITNLKG